jgi:hypothetical protein
MFLSVRSLIWGRALDVTAAGGPVSAFPAGQRTASAKAGESQTPVQVSLSVGGKRFDSSAPGGSPCVASGKDPLASLLV